MTMELNKGTEMSNQIDRQYATCSEKAVSTHDEQECASQAKDLWSAEIAQQFGRFLNSASPEPRAALQKSQAQWDKYSKAEFDAIDLLYGAGSGHGSEGYVWEELEDMDVVKLRSLELENIDSIFKNGIPGDGENYKNYEPEKSLSEQEKKLATAYKELVLVLGAEQKAAMDKSEKEWQKLRDLDFELIDKSIDKKADGNAQRDKAKIDIVFHRTVQVQTRFERLRDGN